MKQVIMMILAPLFRKIFTKKQSTKTASEAIDRFDKTMDSFAKLFQVIVDNFTIINDRLKKLEDKDINK